MSDTVISKKLGKKETTVLAHIEDGQLEMRIQPLSVKRKNSSDTMFDRKTAKMEAILTKFPLPPQK